MPSPATIHDCKLDFYARAEAKSPSGETTLAYLIEALRASEFAEMVAGIRALTAAGDKDGATAAKKNLPAVSLSGVTTGRRARAVAEGRFQHSGLLQIDLDAKDNPGWTIEAMRAALEADPRIVAGFVTASGAGVKGVACIPADPAQHLGAFFAAEAHFATIGLRIDKSCKDPVRLCFVSHDPDAWLRDSSGEMFRPAPAAEEAETDLLEPKPESVSLEAPLPADDEDTEAVISRATGGIIIRRKRAYAITAELIREMLRCIPYPGYDDWLKITNAVWRELGVAEGTAILQEWAPEKNEGDYDEHAKYPLQDVTIGTLVWHATNHGWQPPEPVSAAAGGGQSTAAGAAAPGPTMTPAGFLIPITRFPVPNGLIGAVTAAEHVFSVIAPTRRLFVRGGAVHEVIADEEDSHARLDPVAPPRFVSLIEEFGAKVMKAEKREDGAIRWRASLMGESHCRILLHSTSAREKLPHIAQLASCPVLARGAGGQPVLLSPGWHPHAGGTFVSGRRQIPVMSLEEAADVLALMIGGFNFTTPADASRAVASFLSPAMKLGGWIDDDFPVDVAEADQSQAGKSYRHKLVAAVYGETPFQITNSTGGVGSLDERVGGALIAGRPIITLENIRGRLDSQTLESAIRGVGRVTARGFRASVEVDTRPFVWQLSTNGTELTRDLANRSIITRIRKWPDGHDYETFPEGEILHHIKAHQPRFLAAVHAFIREWARLGCQRTGETGHDFRGWVQVMDWIVQNICGLPPLLEGHREQQLRTANPKLQWLRDVVNALIADGHDPMIGLSASDLAEASEEHDIDIPNRHKGSREGPEQSVGKILSRLFKEAGGEMIVVDGRTIRRQLTQEYNSLKQKNEEKKTYVIELND